MLGRGSFDEQVQMITRIRRAVNANEMPLGLGFENLRNRAVVFSECFIVFSFFGTHHHVKRKRSSEAAFLLRVRSLKQTATKSKICLSPSSGKQLHLRTVHLKCN